MNTTRLLNILDQLVLLGISVMLIMAFYYQFTVHDLPCSMCIMSRMVLYAISFGLILNLTRFRTSGNYFMTIIACLVELAISIEFIVRHIVPGSSTFGSAVFGLHMYVWNFIITLLIIAYCALVGVILNNRQEQHHRVSLITKLIIVILISSLILNTFSTFIECGLHNCPSDPTGYWLVEIFTH